MQWSGATRRRRQQKKHAKMGIIRYAFPLMHITTPLLCLQQMLRPRTKAKLLTLAQTLTCLIFSQTLAHRRHTMTCLIPQQSIQAPAVDPMGHVNAISRKGLKMMFNAELAVTEGPMPARALVDTGASHCYVSETFLSTSLPIREQSN